MSSKILSLTPEERHVKRKLVQATKEIRKKFLLIRANRLESMESLEKMYKPITESLKQVAVATGDVIKPKKEPEFKKENIDVVKEEIADDNDAKSSIHDSYIETDDKQEAMMHPSMHAYVEALQKAPGDLDTTYGMRFDDDGNLRMGKAYVDIRGDVMRFVDNNGAVLGDYHINDALLELIFLKDIPTHVSAEVRENYSKIMIVTEAAYKKYDKLRGLQGTKLEKYKLIRELIVDPFVTPKRPPPPPRLGGGMLRKRFNNNSVVDYRYWDTAKELVDRLRLLWASKLAGNTSQDNEIIAILEELREANIIY